jgi:hypothetical protein
MAQNQKRGGRQKGAVEKGEGQQGDKTRGRFQEILHSRPREEAGHGDAAGDPTHSEPGKHRIFEDRQQHDEAELNSEKNRLSRDIDRHGHDREQFHTAPGAGARGEPAEGGPRADENHPQSPSHSGSGHSGRRSPG